MSSSFTSTHHWSVPGRVAQSVGYLTRKSGSWVRYSVWPHTFVSPSADSRGTVVSYWRKYVHEVLVNRLGGLSLPRKSVVRLFTVDVQQNNNNNNKSLVSSAFIPLLPDGQNILDEIFNTEQGLH